jgi:PIN domain nuclease of toxin-antitoxin system
MDILLDTHTLIWFMEGNVLLPTKIRERIMTTGNLSMVSITSFYEVAIKMNIGKLDLGKTLSVFYQETLDNQIQILPIAESHLSAYVSLPTFATHKDPFDRLIIATAIAEKATVLSVDENFSLYKELVGVEW